MQCAATKPDPPVTKISSFSSAISKDVVRDDIEVMKNYLFTLGLQIKVRRDMRAIEAEACNCALKPRCRMWLQKKYSRQKVAGRDEYRMRRISSPVAGGNTALLLT